METFTNLKVVKARVYQLCESLKEMSWPSEFKQYPDEDAFQFELQGVVVKQFLVMSQFEKKSISIQNLEFRRFLASIGDERSIENPHNEVITAYDDIGDHQVVVLDENGLEIGLSDIRVGYLVVIKVLLSSYHYRGHFGKSIHLIGLKRLGRSRRIQVNF